MCPAHRRTCHWEHSGDAPARMGQSGLRSAIPPPHPLHPRLPAARRGCLRARGAPAPSETRPTSCDRVMEPGHRVGAAPVHSPRRSAPRGARRGPRGCRGLITEGPRPLKWTGQLLMIENRASWVWGTHPLFLVTLKCLHFRETLPLPLRGVQKTARGRVQKNLLC